MISVEQARETILAALSPLPAETVTLTEALGRVLAEPVVARLTQPPVNVSAMDGYALRCDEYLLRRLPQRLRVIGESAAGRGFRGSVVAGEAVRIFTGAPVPAGANTVIIQEHVTTDGDEVIVEEGIAAGRNIRPAGLDFRAGQIGLAAGKTLSARDLGLIAAMDVPWLRVRRRPRVAVLATGDELTLPGDPREPGQIVSSNTIALCGLITACGGAPVNLGIARDTPEALQAAANAAAGADLLVTIGGASVGDYDLVREVLANRGGNLDFWKVAMRPGKPLMFGHCGAVPLLGLPGNPVSAQVCAVLFLRPALRVLLGQPAADPLQPQARLGQAMAANDGRQAYLRASLSRDAAGELVATPFAQQDNAMLSILAAADCLIVRPPHAPAAQAGERTTIVPLGGGCIGF